MAQQTVVIRADASPSIGLGHVMRCLALAQGLRDGGARVVLATASTLPAVEARLRAEGVVVVAVTAPPGSAADAAETIALASAENASWVVLDSYQAGPDFRRAVRRSGARLLVVDDLGFADSEADLVLNQNLHAAPALYPGCRPDRLLLGVGFALLRRELDRYRAWQRTIPTQGRAVLVTLGGADPHNVTGLVLDAVARTAVVGLEVQVLVGAANPNRAGLEELARTDPRLAIASHADDVGVPMAAADVAIAGAGSTCWELAMMGLPALLTVLAANQAPLAERLELAGVAVNLGPAEHLRPATVAEQLTTLLADHGRRTTMSSRGRALVDGLGVSRVVAAMGGGSCA